MAGSFLKSGILVAALPAPSRAETRKVREKTLADRLDREGRRGRFAGGAIGAVLLLSACGQTGNGAAAGPAGNGVAGGQVGNGTASGQIGNGATAEPSPDGVSAMLANGDSRVCVDNEVQQTVVRVINSDAYNRMRQRGERFEFNSVSAAGNDRNISEVTCNANIVAWQENDYPVSWSVRPALDRDGYVVFVHDTRRLHAALGAKVFSQELEDRASPTNVASKNAGERIDEFRRRIDNADAMAREKNLRQHAREMCARERESPDPEAFRRMLGDWCDGTQSGERSVQRGANMLQEPAD
jgi:hypothetical protein